MGIDHDDQVHGVAPDIEALVRPLLRITNHESPIPALQPITNSGWSNSTGWPLSHWIASTVPATSASIGLNIFIASMMPSVSPALTCWPTLTKAGVPGVAEASNVPPTGPLTTCPARSPSGAGASPTPAHRGRTGERRAGNQS